MEIIFSEPDISKGKCVDMHFHTRHSDGSANIKETLERARELGIGVSITDHNEISGVIEAFKINDSKDLVIPGIEVKSREMVDILFYFYELKDLERFFAREIRPKKRRFLHSSKTMLTLPELYGLSKRYRCVTSVAHPFGYALRLSIGDVFNRHLGVLQKFDCIEIINGGNTLKQNLRAERWLKGKKHGVTAGSDGHSLQNLGNVVTCTEAKDVETFLDRIKAGEVILMGKGTRLGKFGEYVVYAINQLNRLIK